MTHRYHRETLRRLVVSSALAGSLFAFAGAAHGQALPTNADVISTIPSTAGVRPVISNPDADTLQVRLRATNTVINWDGFNVPAGKTADFQDATGGPANPIAVLNRDLNASGNISQILGTLQSNNNVAVWVYNPNGILVGNNAVINVGGLVLSTLDIDDPTNFNGSGTYALATSAGSTAKIQVGANASITTNGNAGLVLVAPQIDAAGATGTTFSGGTGEVAFVAATDVSLSYGFGSPLGITINKGTAFNGASVVAGNISGKNIFFAIASQSTVTDALLQVNADATTAVTSNKGIVLLGGQTSVTGSGVSVATGAGTDTSGVAGITANGALVSSNKVAAAATGDVTVAGAVTAATDYTVTGKSVTLGDPGGVAKLQQAAGLVTIKSNAGDITGKTGLTLRSNSDDDTGVGAEALTLDVTGGNIAFASGSALAGGSNKQSDVQINADLIGSGLSLGDVTARNLLDSVGGVPATTIERTGTVTLGNVDLVGSLAVTSDTGDVSVGSISVTDVGSSIKLTSTAGGITSPALTNLTADGDIELQAATPLNVGSATSTSGHVTVNGGANVTTGALSAGTFATVTANGSAQVGGLTTSAGNAQVTAGGSATINGPVSAVGDYLVTGAGVSLGGTQSATGAVTIESTGAANDLSALAGLSLTANSDSAGGELLSLKTAGGLALGGSSLTNTAGTVRFITPTDTSAFVVGDVNALQLSQQVGAAAPVDGTITRTGAITFGNITTGSPITLSSNAALVTGAVSSPGAINLTGATVTATSASSAAAGPVNVTANTGDLIIGSVDSGSTASLKTLGATGDVRVDNVTAAGTITVSSAGGVRGDTGTRANLTSTGGDVTVTASNSSTATLGTASAANNLSITAGTIDVLTPSATAGSLTLNATTGSLTVGTISAPAGVTLNTNGDLIVGSATSSAGNVSLTSVTGNTTVGDINAATSVLVQAAGTASVTGNVTAGTTYAVTGGIVNLGVDADAELQKAAAGVTITANSGLITGGTGLTLLGNSDDAGGEDVRFNLAPAGIDFSAATIKGGTTRTSRVVFGYTNTATPIKIGNTSGSTFGAFDGVTNYSNFLGGLTGSVTTGDLDFSQFSSIQVGTVTTGAINASGGFSLNGTNGVTVNGPVTSASSFNANSSAGAVALNGNVNATNVGVSAATAATGLDVTSTVGAISITGGSVGFSDLDSKTTLGVTANSGTLTLDSGKAATTLTLAGAGGVTVPTLNAGGTINVSSSGGPVTIAGNVTSGGDYIVSGTAVNLGVDPDAELQQATGAVTITATSGLITGGTGLTLLGNSDNAGGEDVRFNLAPAGIDFSAATIQGGTTRSSRIFFGYTNTATPIKLGNVSGSTFAGFNGTTTFTNYLGGLTGTFTSGDLDFSGFTEVDAGTITTGAINATSGFTLSGTNGVTVNGLLTSPGSFTAFSSTGNVALNGNVNAGSVSVTAATAATGLDVTSTTGSISITGGSVGFSDLDSKTTLGVTANSGSVTLDSGKAVTTLTLAGTTGVTVPTLNAGGTINVSSSGGPVTIAGNVTSGGDYIVSGTAVNLGVDPDAELQQATGAVTITATSGLITGGTGLTLLGNSDNAGGEDVRFNLAPAGIDFSAATIQGGTTRSSRIFFGYTNTATPIKLGNVSGSTFGAFNGTTTFTNFVGGLTGTFTTGNLDFSNFTSVEAGTVTTGAINASGGFGLSGTNGVTVNGPVTSAGSFSANSSAGAVALNGNVNATSVGVTAAGAATGLDVTTTTGAISITGSSVGFSDLDAKTTLGVTATSGNITLDTAKAATTVTLNANQAINFTTVTAGTDATLTAGTNITGDTLTAGNIFTANAGGTVSIAHTTASGVGIVASVINLPATNVTGALSLKSTVGGITLGGGSAGTTADFNAATTLDITAPFTSGGAMTLVANGAATVDTLTSTGGSVSLTAGSVSANSINAATTLLLKTTGGDANVTGQLKSGGLLTVTTSGNAALATVESTGGDLALTAGGALTATSLKSGTGAVGATGASVAVTTASAATSLSLKSTAGALSLDTGTAGTTATLNAAGPLTITTSLTATGDVAATSTGAITGGLIKSTGGATTISGASTDLAEADANGLLKITTTGGELKLGKGTAGSATLNAAGPLTVTTSLTTSGDISATATGAIKTGVIKSTGGAVTISGASTDLAEADANGLLKITTTGGELKLGQGTAGSATLNAAGPLTVTTSLTTSGDISATATGAVTAALIKSTAGAVTISGASTDLTEADASGALKVTTTGGTLKLGQATAASAILNAAGPLTVTGFVHTTGDATATATGAATIADIESSGGAVSITGATVDATTTKAATALALNATAGDLSVGAETAGTTLSLTATGNVQANGALVSGGNTTVSAGGNARLTSVSATNGTVTVTAGSAVTGVGGGRVDLSAGGAGHGVTVTAGTQALLGTVTAPGDVKVTGATIDATTTRSTAGALTLTSTGGALTVGTAASATTTTLNAAGALNVTTLQSGGAATATATGAATLGTTTSGGDLKVTGAGITAGTTTVTGALTFTSTGDIALSQATVSGAASLDATGRATLGAVTAGPSITVKATDAALGGTLKASAVTLANRGPGTLRLGGTTASDGFQLSATEINLVDTDKLTLDGGTGPVAIGALAFGANAGRTNVDVVTTGAMSVTDVVSGSGTGRTFRFGGSTTDANALASEIRIVATASAGGRLLFAGAGLDLRGNKIVLGQTQFVDAVMGTPADAVPGIFVSNPNSSLYNAALSGGPYDPANATVISATTLNVRYGSFALFQNTGPAGTNAGSEIGGTVASPVNNALVLKGPGSSTPNSFALFGTINGVNGTATALLGTSVISVSAINLPNSRINGCIIGSGAGCLTTTISQPSLSVFDSSRLDIFRSADDFSLPFDPVVGGNNEALFAGISAIDAPVNPNCPDSKTGTCPTPEEKQP